MRLPRRAGPTEDRGLWKPGEFFGCCRLLLLLLLMLPTLLVMAWLPLRWRVRALLRKRPLGCDNASR